MNIWETAVTDGAIQASKEAVTPCITMLRAITLWTGVLEIGYCSGLVNQLVGRMGPIFILFFPRLNPDGKAREQVSVNVAANMLRLGWTATLARLKAMEELKEVEEEHRKRGAAGQKDTPGQRDAAGQKAVAKQAETANNKICIFLIINVSSLQLIPVNMVVYRSQHGSVSPTTIAGPALAIAFIGTVAVMIFCRIMGR